MEMLRQLRVKNGLTQEQLAKKIGVSDATINMYEKGLRKPKYDKILKLAVALKIESRILIAESYGVSVDEENVTISNLEYKYLKEIEEKYNAIKTLVSD